MSYTFVASSANKRLGKWVREMKTLFLDLIYDQKNSLNQV